VKKRKEGFLDSEEINNAPNKKRRWFLSWISGKLRKKLSFGTSISFSLWAKARRTKKQVVGGLEKKAGSLCWGCTNPLSDLLRTLVAWSFLFFPFLSFSFFFSDSHKVSASFASRCSNSSVVHQNEFFNESF
jgi:hypothetical protein